MSSLNDLQELMRALRDPQSGCPWDQKQTFETIAPYTIEEAYEVADAIEREALDELKDELGDLLFQVAFHSQLASEQGAFDFDDVTQGIVAKMHRRHPHVFGDLQQASEEAVNQAWEAGKAAERAAAAEGPISALDGIAVSLPALTRANKIQKRAARVGFDWPAVGDVWNKLHEEKQEVLEAASITNVSERDDALEDELGDLLFVAVNLSRHYKVDPEKALRRANNKFEQRFRAVEVLAAEQQTDLSDMDSAGLDTLWNRAKKIS